ncbi:small vasohibin-binding protein isoform X1 [Xenopus laevis]|uniref:Small vasohibin-binding protein isoform X1 n=1 Tax=Xenopus laevis TaxID=8355 RepID=A0A8J1LFF9_XENLA|nr:small vasohibin-binding protein isoform X1 [Xenopus laevis]
MEPAGRREKPKGKDAANRQEKAKQKSAQQELKQRQRAEPYPVIEFSGNEMTFLQNPPVLHVRLYEGISSVSSSGEH